MGVRDLLPAIAALTAAATRLPGRRADRDATGDGAQGQAGAARDPARQRPPLERGAARRQRGRARRRAGAGAARPGRELAPTAAATSASRSPTPPSRSARSTAAGAERRARPLHGRVRGAQPARRGPGLAASRHRQRRDRTAGRLSGSGRRGRPAASTCSACLRGMPSTSARRPGCTRGWASPPPSAGRATSATPTGPTSRSRSSSWTRAPQRWAVCWRI